MAEVIVAGYLAGCELSQCLSPPVVQQGPLIVKGKCDEKTGSPWGGAYSLNIFDGAIAPTLGCVPFSDKNG